MADDQLPEIDLAQLEAVFGGAASAEITTMLQSLLSSIKDLASARQSSGPDFMQMLPLIMMMQQRRQPEPVAAPAPPSPGDGWIRVA